MCQQEKRVSVAQLTELAQALKSARQNFECGLSEFLHNDQAGEYAHMAAKIAQSQIIAPGTPREALLLKLLSAAEVADRDMVLTGDPLVDDESRRKLNILCERLDSILEVVECLNGDI